MGAPARDQDSYRGRDDDVALNSATFNGGGGLNTGWTQDVNTNFRIRYLVQETGGGMAENTILELWFTHTQGAGVPEVMTATSALRPALTAQYTDGDTTTQVLGAGTYTSGESIGGVTDAVVTGNLDLSANTEAECEFCLTINSTQVADGDTFTNVEVRLSTDARLDTYTNSLTITVNEVGGGIVVPALDEGMLLGGLQGLSGGLE